MAVQGFFIFERITHPALVNLGASMTRTWHVVSKNKDKTGLTTWAKMILKESKVQPKHCYSTYESGPNKSGGVF